MKRTLRYNLVDVFTDTPLAGNPLSVFTRAQGLSGETMQSIAREMNLSETVFFFPPQSGGHALLRIFTPRRELPFAGHPVLGSAWVMGHPMEMETLRLETGAGIIAVDLFREGGQLHLARMSQPIPTFSVAEQSTEFYQALGLGDTGKHLPVVEARNGALCVLVELPSRAVLDSLNPDLTHLARLSSGVVYAFAQEGLHCFARSFAPAAGINEDPATGSAAGPLAAHLVLHGRLESEQTLSVHQGQAMLRPSLLLATAKVAEGGQVAQVTVGGAAVVVGRGELLL